MNSLALMVETFALVFCAMAGSHYGRVPLRKLIQIFRRAARYKKTCVVACGLFPILVRLLLLPAMPVPRPAIDDEFSYLLGADTFASGRLTNPPHPEWIHFETIHEIQQPTYMTKYPPLQSLFLALGLKVFGHPWAGVLLSAGLLCGGLCWMLQGWLPPAWALLGALIAAVQFVIFHYWANSYWGGAVAAFAGTLLLGAAGRIRSGRYNPVAMGLILGLGAGMLANSRPLEGALLTAMAAVWLLLHRRLRWIPAAGVVLAVCAGMMAYYNYRVTGSALLLPYEVHERQYAYTPTFLYLQPHRPMPAYHHEEIRRFWTEWDEGIYQMYRNDPWAGVTSKLRVIWYFFVGNWPLTLPLFATPFLWTSRRGRFPLAAAAITLAVLLLYKAVLPHYLAPLTGLLVLLILLGLHRLTLWRPLGRPTGKLLVIVVLAATFVQFSKNVVHPPRVDLIGDPRFKDSRDRVISQLNAAPGKHLVMVRYQASLQPVHEEWVYNAADIDGSRIVWAREMTPEQDRPLLDYFRERDVWLLQPDGPGPLLSRVRGSLPISTEDRSMLSRL